MLGCCCSNEFWLSFSRVVVWLDCDWVVKVVGVVVVVVVVVGLRMGCGRTESPNPTAFATADFRNSPLQISVIFRRRVWHVTVNRRIAVPCSLHLVAEDCSFLHPFHRRNL